VAFRATVHVTNAIVDSTSAPLPIIIKLGESVNSAMTTDSALTASGISNALGLSLEIPETPLRFRAGAFEN